MSAMPEESDVDSEEDGFVARASDGSSDTDVEGQQADRGGNTPSSAHNLLPEEDGQPEQQPFSELDGTIIGGYERIKQSDPQLTDESSGRVILPALGRPSSADGILSTPDDTPSVQVRYIRT